MKMLFVLFIVSVVSFGAQARIFDNPLVKEGNSPEPSVVLIDGTYYAVTSSIWTKEHLPIRASKDLQNWELVGNVLNSSNYPSWSYTSEFSSPEVYVLENGKIRVYFEAKKLDDDRTVIGVAVADNILGPYTVKEHPLLAFTSVNLYEPSIYVEDGETYFIVRQGFDVTIRRISKNGLSFPDNEVTVILSPTVWGDYGIISSPNLVLRNGTYYLFYSSDVCNMMDIKVAKSDHILGPYKRGSTLIETKLLIDTMSGPGGTDIIKDVDGTTDIILYHVYQHGDSCYETSPRYMCAQTILWGEDGWPTVTNN